MRRSVLSFMLIVFIVCMCAMTIHAQVLNESVEFRVNTYVTGNQVVPSVGIDDVGNYVIAWASEGQDGSGYGIFAQRYDSFGNELGSEFQVNTTTDLHQVYPQIGMSGSGNFVVVWNGILNGGSGWGIFAQRFDSSGSKIGDELQINSYIKPEPGLNAFQEHPDVAMDDNGNFVAVWRSYKSESSGLISIYAQCYDVSTNTLGERIQANTFAVAGEILQESQVAMNKNGEFIITWNSQNQDGSGFGIYAQRYYSSGIRNGGEFQVNTTTASDQMLPHVALRDNGDYIITWTSSDQDGSGRGVYGQRYNALGSKIDGEFRINSYTNSHQTGYEVSINGNGDYVATWTSYGQDGSGWGIYAQRYNASGAKVGNELRVNTYTNSDQESAKVAISENGNFVITWDSTLQDGFGDGIYAKRFFINASPTSTPTPIPPSPTYTFTTTPVRTPIPFQEFQVNTYATGDQLYPRMAMNATGNFVIVWHGLGQNGSDAVIYARRYNALGTPLSGDIQVNTNFSWYQGYPWVGMNENGDFVVTWESTTIDGSGYGVAARWFDSNGLPLGSEFKVNTYTTGHQRTPAIAMNTNGQYVISWTSYDQDGSERGIFAQPFSSSGNRIGNEIPVNTITQDRQDTSEVAIDDNGNFIIAWHSAPLIGNEHDIYARRFTASGTPLGPEFLVNTHTNLSQNIQSIAMYKSGQFVIAWGSNHTGSGDFYSNFELYAQRYDSSGNRMGGEFQVNTSTPGQQGRPSLGMYGNGAFVVSWMSKDQDGSGWGVYARRYDASGNPLEGEFRVNSYTSLDQQLPSLGVDNIGNFVITWQSDGQDDSGNGIFARRYLVNQAPIAYGNIYTVTQGTLLPVDLSAIDPDGDSLEYRYTQPTHGSLTGTSPHLTYVSLPSYSGPDQFGFSASDGLVSSNTATVNITVNSVPTVPTATHTYTPIPTSALPPTVTPAPTIIIGSSAEFRVNTYTNLDQEDPSVAMDASGNFVITWGSEGQDNSGRGVYARRYSAAGASIGNISQVNTYTNTDQHLPWIAMDKNGNYVIVWESNHQDGSSWGIYAQRYDRYGMVAGSEFQVNNQIFASQTFPSVAMDDQGNFVITWTGDGQDGSSNGIYARRYDSFGIALGNEFQVNTYTNLSQEFSSVAMDGDGNFVIAWVSEGQDGSGTGIYARRYNSSGIPLSGDFGVNTRWNGDQKKPSVAMDGNGNFVIVWTSDGQDGSSWGVYAQRYNNNGIPIDGEFQINTYTDSGQHSPSIAMDSSGNFVVAWASGEQDSSGNGVYARYFDSTGNPLVDEFQVNTYTESDQQHISTAINDNGNVVVAWMSWFQDGSEWGIYARQFTIITVNPTPTPTNTYTPTATNTPTSVPTNTYTPIPTTPPTPIPTPDPCCEEIITEILINRGLIKSASEVILGRLNDLLVDTTQIHEGIMATNRLIHSTSTTLLDEIKASRSDIGMASASLHDELDLLQRQLTGSTEVLSASIGSIQIPPLLKEDLIREINDNEVKIDAASRNLDIRIGDLSQFMQTDHQALWDAVATNQMRIDSASAAILEELQNLPWDKVDKKLNAVGVNIQAQSAEIQSASGILNTKVHDLFTSVESGNGSILTKLTDAELGIQENIDAVQNSLLAQVSQSATDVLDALDSFELPVDIVVDAIRENRAVIDNATAYLDNRVFQVEGQLHTATIALASDISTAESSLQTTLAQTGDLIEQARVDVIQKVDDLAPVLSGITDEINENETLIDAGADRTLAQLQNQAERIESATEYIELLVEDLRDEINSSEDAVLTELGVAEQGIKDTIDNQTDRLSSQIDQSTLSIRDAVSGLQTPIQLIMPEVNENQAKIAEATEYLEARVQQVGSELESARLQLQDLQNRTQLLLEQVAANGETIGSASESLSQQIKDLLQDQNSIGAVMLGLALELDRVDAKADQIVDLLNSTRQREIEDHLANNEILVQLFMLRDDGGELEDVAELVKARIELVESKGVSARNAWTNYNNGVAQFNAGKYYDAFLSFSSAYRELTKVPK